MLSVCLVNVLSLYVIRVTYLKSSNFFHSFFLVRYDLSGKISASLGSCAASYSPPQLSIVINLHHHFDHHQLDLLVVALCGFLNALLFTHHFYFDLQSSF